MFEGRVKRLEEKTGTKPENVEKPSRWSLRDWIQELQSASPVRRRYHGSTVLPTTGPSIFPHLNLRTELTCNRIPTAIARKISRSRRRTVVAGRTFCHQHPTRATVGGSRVQRLITLFLS